MGYQMYHASLRTLAGRLDISQQTLLRRAYSMDPRIEGAGLKSMLNEWWWAEQEHQSIWVEPRWLADFCSSIPISGGISHVLEQFRGARAIMFNGHDGLLFTHIPAEDRAKWIAQPLSWALGYEINPEFATESRDTVAVQFMGGEGLMRGMHYFIWPVEWLDQLLDKPLDQIECKDLVAGPWEGPLTEAERLEQVRVLRRCLGLLTYLRVYPELLLSGAPGSVKPKALGIEKPSLARARFHILRDHPTWDMIAGEHGKVPHYRRSHLRILGHERYTRNPDGSVRVVHVREAYIGKGKVVSGPEES